jgi:hypothetical protein
MVRPLKGSKHIRELLTGVAELRECSMEKAVLFPERLVVRASVRFLCLKSHVCISDLWDRRANSSVSLITYNRRKQGRGLTNRTPQQARRQNKQ